MKKFTFTLALAISFVFSSCDDSETSFYDLIGGSEELSFGGTTDEIIDVIGQAAYDAITQDLAFPINTGSTPPTIEGVYIMNPTEQYNSGIGSYEESDRFIYFSCTGQTSNLEVQYQADFYSTGPDGSIGGGDDVFILDEIGFGRSFISGNSNTGAFTLIVKTDLGDGRTDVIALSGIFAGNGQVENLEYAYVEFDNGDPATGNITTAGKFRDADFTSELF
jgi:hypothetical protein